MKLVMKNICGLLMLGVVMIGAGTLMSATFPQDKRWPESDLAEVQQPEIKKLKSYKGEIFKNFAEFRVQQSSFNQVGIIKLEGEVYEMLINVNQIVKVHRFEDGKKTDYSSLMFIAEDKHPRGIVPVLVREEYDEILKRIRRAAEIK